MSDLHSCSLTCPYLELDCVFFEIGVRKAKFKQSTPSEDFFYFLFLKVIVIVSFV